MTDQPPPAQPEGEDRDDRLDYDDEREPVDEPEPLLRYPTPEDLAPPSRRAIMWAGIGGVVAIAAAVAATAALSSSSSAPSASPSRAAATTPAPTPTTTVAALPNSGAPAMESVPEAVASFGPNGTHWPSDTPWITGTVDVELQVPCTWAAISAAITQIVQNTPAEATARILVAPGILPGAGAASGSAATLRDVGSLDRATRILVYPRDGYGTVTVEGSWRWARVFGVAFGGIVTRGGFMATGCSGSAFARIKVDAAHNVYGADGVEYTENIELVEVVVPAAQLRNEDVSGMRTPTDGTGSLRQVTRIACYTAPGYMEAGSSAHTDTVQFSGQNNNYYGEFTSIDCIDFASTNTAFQIGSAPSVRFEHCLVVGGSVGKAVHPLPDGADTGGSHSAVNGPGESYGCTAFDSTFIGAMGDATWAEVRRSRVGYVSSGAAPRSGRWTVDGGILDWSAERIRDLSPTPDDAYLASIWGP
ncbi:hypothetical protein HQQ80_12440 [Microbacteriaceae bacterium VKM Ac-2855]|nr:hypothetical protein [Microbacteriaceae bacterium VKM Ac-2855]